MHFATAMNTLGIGFGWFIAALVLILIAGLVLIASMFRKVEQGRALIISKIGDRRRVTFTGAIVVPIFHKAEEMDISVKTLEIERSGKEGLICQDNIRADIRITFFVRVNKTKEDVINVAQAIGTARASDQEVLRELFSAKTSEALKTVGKQLDFEDLYTKRDEFRDRIIELIGTDLNGYSLEDAAIDYLEQTPLSQLDSDNILDAQGIRKITELTAVQAVRTNDYERNKEKEMTRQNVAAREAVLELERRQADAETKQVREVETMRAREEAETERVRFEERLKAEAARIRTAEQVGVQEENRKREVAVAEKNRERVIAIESERIEKDRVLEVVARDRETQLAQMAKDKEVEIEKRAVADVVRERVAVDKTVAEQEESIKRVRAVEEAERERQALVIKAEAEAQEQLVKDIKAAEAAEEAAKHRAAEQLKLADARQQTAELDARAKIRLAEGTQAESAAQGLAKVQVAERNAEAVEKTGLAEARVERKKAEASAETIDRAGRAEAGVEREKALAAAEGLREKLKGESEGLTEKAAAMAALDEASRGHEEYRLRLEAEKELRMAGIDVQRQVAEAQANVLATGLQGADINIVGGESVFFDRLVNAITLGRSVDGFVGNSDVAQTLGRPWLEGDSSFTEDLSRVLTSVDAGDVRDVTISALLLKLIGAGGPQSAKLQELLDAAQRLGVADAPVGAVAGAKR